MASAASILLEFPPNEGLSTNEAYDQAAQLHIAKVDSLFREHAPMIAEQGVEILQVLNPAVNTISYLAIFNALGDSPKYPVDKRLEDLVTFLLSFDPRQIRYVGGLFSSWLDRVAAGQLLPHDVAVEVLAEALLRVDPTGSMLTSHHLSLVSLSYETNNVEPAFRVTDKHIVYFPGMARDASLYNRSASAMSQKPLCDMSLPPIAYIMPETGLTNILTVDQVLTYDLTCGLMYCSARQWEKARAAFERVITHPTRDGGLSKIMTEAYGKWLLVSLLVSGRTPAMPATTDSTVRKTYKLLGKPYDALAAHFDSMAAGPLKAEVERNAKLWQDDRNTGLIQEVLAAHQKWQIIDLNKIYSKVSLSDIRESTCSAETGNNLPSVEDVEALIQGMIRSGMFKGVIEKPAGKPAYLKFLTGEADELSEPEYQREIAAVMARMKDLEAIYKTTKGRLATNPYYVKHVIREQRREKESGSNQVLNFEATVEDEDLMSGVVPGS